MKWLTLGGFVLIAVVLIAVFSNQKTPTPKEVTMQPNGSFQLTSSAFTEGQTIPTNYTCKGSNINPPLTISGAPTDTKSFAIIMHDPDAPAGDFLHWTVWNISADTSSIAENSVPAGAIQGKTGFGKNGYGGPCPPSGTHQYIFELYALDTPLNLPEGASRNDLINAMQSHIKTETKLTGLVSA